MPYTAEQDPECGCWLVSRDGHEDRSALNCHQDGVMAADLARLLNWAEEDRLRHAPVAGPPQRRTQAGM